MWFGWSGRTGDPHTSLTRAHAQGIEYVTMDLNERQLADYYNGFCNSVLWPVLHGLESGEAPDASTFQTYHSVNRLFASTLFPLLRDDDIVWVHDYHLFAVGHELRRLGWRGRIGYFHHIPVPAADQWAQLPNADLIGRWLRGYDLVGVQTVADARRLRANIGGAVPIRVGAYPVGIDPERFRRLAHGYPENPVHRARDQRQVMIGIDRLDYTKGIRERLEAFEYVLAADPGMATRVRFVQWAAPSRSEVEEYRAYRREVETIAARINERHAELQPVRLDISPHPPEQVAAALRAADICLVTSLADGMNLVAKEFSAVHSSANPGVLILSDTCGASEQLTEALAVRSTDVRSIAGAIREAIDMPVVRRARRSAYLRTVVDIDTTHRWLDRFLVDLMATVGATAAGGLRRPQPVAS